MKCSGWHPEQSFLEGQWQGHNLDVDRGLLQRAVQVLARLHIPSREAERHLPGRPALIMSSIASPHLGPGLGQFFFWWGRGGKVSLGLNGRMTVIPLITSCPCPRIPVGQHIRGWCFFWWGTKLSLCLVGQGDLFPANLVMLNQLCWPISAFLAMPTCLDQPEHAESSVPSHPHRPSTPTHPCQSASLTHLHTLCCTHASVPTHPHQPGCGKLF